MLDKTDNAGGAGGVFDSVGSLTHPGSKARSKTRTGTERVFIVIPLFNFVQDGHEELLGWLIVPTD